MFDLIGRVTDGAERRISAVPSQRQIRRPKPFDFTALQHGGSNTGAEKTGAEKTGADPSLALPSPLNGFTLGHGVRQVGHPGHSVTMPSRPRGGGAG